MGQTASLSYPAAILGAEGRTHLGLGVLVRSAFFERVLVMHHRRVDPIRQHSPVHGAKRRKLQAACQAVDTELAQLDDQLDRLCEQRREVASRRRQLHNNLWPNLAKRGRRAAPDGSHALPPVLANAQRLYGRRLRATCLDVLSRLGSLALVELHAHLHRLGMVVDHRHPVKALADALGYEADRGRAARTARGVYELVPGTVVPRTSALR